MEYLPEGALGDALLPDGGAMLLAVVPSGDSESTAPVEIAPVLENARAESSIVQTGENSVLQSVGVLCNVIIALGVLNMPHIFNRTGVLAFAALALSATIAVRNALLVHKSMMLVASIEREEGLYTGDRQDWGSLVARAYASGGETFARIIFIGELSSYTMSFLTTLGNLAHELLPGYSSASWTASATLFGVVLSTLPMKMLGSASLVAHGSYVAVFISLILTGWLNLTAEGAENVPQLWEERLKPMAPTGAQLADLPMAFSIFVFCLAGHSVLPTVYSSMADKKAFKQVVVTSYSAAVVVYMLVGLSGYLVFGEHTAQVITSNIATDMSTGRDLPGWTQLRKASTFMVIIKLQLCIPIFLQPVFTSLEELVRLKERTRALRDRWPRLLVPSYTCFFRFVRYFCRLAFLTVLGMSSICFKDQVALAVSLAGATFGTALVFVLPPVVYIGLSRQAGHCFSLFQKLEFAASLLIGFSSGLLATGNCVSQFLVSDASL